MASYLETLIAIYEQYFEIFYKNFINGYLACIINYSSF